MDLEFTKQDVAAMLETPIGEYQRDRELCHRSGHVRSHMEQVCHKCGCKDWDNISRWTIFNVMQRVNTPFRRETWLPTMMGYYLAQKLGNIHSFEVYRFFIRTPEAVKRLEGFYHDYKNERACATT